MSPAEITRMFAEENKKKFGHEQMMKHEYKQMTWLIRRRKDTQKLIDNFEKVGALFKDSNEVLKQAKNNVKADTKALENYKKWYPKCYAIELKRLANKESN